MSAYGIPNDLVFIIKNFYDNFTCREGNSNYKFQVKTGVQQGCVMSEMLFNIAVDWVMRRRTEDRPRGLQWTLLSREDLDYVDDLALLSHVYQHMQEKTSHLSHFSQQIGLKISQKKTEVMALNTKNISPIQVNGEDLPTTDEFTYLGSIVRNDGGPSKDIQNRLSKARSAFGDHNSMESKQN